MIRGTMSAPPLVSIFLLSCSALAYEILLIRLFAIMHWHHFAFMVISLALLGYGASGTFISIFRGHLLRHFDGYFQLNGLFYGLSMLLCFLLVNQLPFNTLEILWDPGQWLRLMLTYLLLSLPFFFVANAIALSFIRFPADVARIYGIDLVAAGCGAALAVLLLEIMLPAHSLKLLSLLGLAALLFLPAARGNRRAWLALAAAAMLVLSVPRDLVEPAMSEYKGLSQALMAKDARHLEREDSSYSRLDVVANETIPLRHAPGLSLHSPVGPPRQLALFRDGDEMHALDLPRQAQDYYAHMPHALPYLMRPDAERVLLLPPSAGAVLQQARAFGVGHIDALEPDRRLTELQQRFASLSPERRDGQPVIEHHHSSARAFIARSGLYDLILLGPPGAATGGGVTALAESYDLTVEALSAYLDHLETRGLLAITLWTDNPPRANLKLFAATVAALSDNGVGSPARHIAWIRSWNTATLVVGRQPLTDGDLATVRDFSQSRGFDMAWLPGLDEAETNRHQVLQQPDFFVAARALLGADGRQYIENYRFDIRPASDDRPYFEQFFKWSGFAQLWQLPAQAWLSLVGLGYPSLILTLVQALVAALLLILLPLLIFRKRRDDLSAAGASLGFFLTIGLGFLMVEIALIQRFTLIFGQPIYAVSVILGSFLVFSGAGSLYVQSWLRRKHKEPQLLMRRSIIMLILIALAYLLLLPPLTEPLLAQPTWLRLLLTIAATAPLAFFMGMPFMLGLVQLQLSSPGLVPWAWGINGCASVLSAILAVLLAVHIGFSGVMLGAMGLYLLALAASRGLRASHSGTAVTAPR